MFAKIVLGFDGSEGAKRALSCAAELMRAAPAELHLVAVGRLPEYAEAQDEIDEAREQAEAYYTKQVKDALAFLRERGLDAKTHVGFGKPSEQILRRAEEVGADLIMLGVHPHHPIRRRLLGATADKIVDHAECSVLVVR